MRPCGEVVQQSMRSIQEAVQRLSVSAMRLATIQHGIAVKPYVRRHGDRIRLERLRGRFDWGT